MLEILNRSLMRFRSMSRGKRSKIPSLPGFRVLLARVQTVLARLEFSNHGRILAASIRISAPHFFLVRLAFTAELWRAAALRFFAAAWACLDRDRCEAAL